MRKVRRIPYAYKLMASYLLIMLLLTVTIGTYAYTVTVNSKRDNTEAGVTRSLEQLRQNMSYQIRDVARLTDQLFNDYTLQRMMLRTEYDYDLYYAMVNSLLPKLDTTLNMSLNRMALILYVTNPQVKEIYDPKVFTNPMYTEKSFHLLHLSRIADADWYKRMGAADYTAESGWKQVDTDGQLGHISLLRRLISFDNLGREIGWLRIVVNKETLFQSIDSFRYGDEAEAYVVDRQNHHVVYSNQSQSEIVPRESPSESGNLVIREALPNTDWELVVEIPARVLTREADRVRNVTLAVCLLSFIGMALISLFTARYFARRVHKIVLSLHTFREGQLHKRIRMRGDDEFTDIAAAFNGMADNIEELINKVYVSGIQRREAELEVLQAQINPHFLYNTLSSINSLAQMGEKGKLNRMVTGLTRFYRLTLNEGSPILSIDRELKQVKAYVEIQKIKYMDGLTVSYDIDQEVLPHRTVKIILQPIVENAIKHAWYEEKLHIRIVACREHREICFKVIDNGIGMDQRTMDRVSQSIATLPGEASKPRRKSGYGLRNVNERIQLQFGRQYGVELFSGLGIGTTVMIRIPVDG